MKCFNHNSIDAVGICKHCQKALCMDCCTDLGHGLACKDKCESAVELLNSLIQNNAKAYSSSPKATLFGPIFNIIIGLLFIWFGIQNSNFFVFFGGAFIAFGIALLIYNSRYFKKIKTNLSET